MEEPIVIKKHPIIIIRNLIFLQFLASGAYFIAALIGNYGEVYQGLNFDQSLSYEIARFLFLMAAEILIIGLIFLRWFFEAHTIYADEIVHEYGILFRRRDKTALPRPFVVSCQYSVFAKLFRYGAIVIQGKDKKESIVLRHVLTPETYRKRILERERGMVRADFAGNTRDIGELLGEREREKLEFKSSLRWDRHEHKVNREVEKATLKTIAAFLNSEGGHLLVGVADSGEIMGLEHDYATLRKQNADGFENHFTNIFHDAIGSELRRFVKLHFHNVAEKEVCAIQVLPAAKPAYMRFDDGEHFYIRTGNSTAALPLSQVAAYVQSHWGRVRIS